MKEKENILDSDEVIQAKTKNYKFAIIIGFGFFASIIICMFLVLAFDDPGFFLPKTKFINAIIPDRLNYIESDYEIRCLEGVLWEYIAIYFGLLGLFNFIFWRNDNLKKIRLGHAIITIGLAFIFFLTMLEEDIGHELKIRNPIGKIQYENKVEIFYKIFALWIIIQISYFLIFFKDKIQTIKNK